MGIWASGNQNFPWILSPHRGQGSTIHFLGSLWHVASILHSLVNPAGEWSWSHSPEGAQDMVISFHPCASAKQPGSVQKLRVRRLHNLVSGLSGSLESRVWKGRLSQGLRATRDYKTRATFPEFPRAFHLSMPLLPISALGIIALSCLLVE